MVTVIGYDQRKSDEGKEFFTVTIQGDVEVVESHNGNLYMTARKTSIPTTFDEARCELLIGKEIPGKIVKLDCEPYEFQNEDTGEIITLTHTYSYEVESEKVENLTPTAEFDLASHFENTRFAPA